MTPFMIFLLLLLLGGIVAWVLIVRSARALARENPDAPPKLPGIWPRDLQEGYQRLSEEQKRQWWKRYWRISNCVLMPLLALMVITFLLRQFEVAVLLGVLLVLALFYSVYGGTDSARGS